MSEPISLSAHAKLNVFLRVLGSRGDGYHDIETVILPLDLADTVTLEPAAELELEIAGPLASDIGATEDNLALVAARALRDRVGARSGARIEVHKRIPVAAGMGGGSADAAATLRGLNALWDCGLGEVELTEIAAAVGADVPALMHRGAVFADGRGSRVTPVHAVTTWWVVKPLDFGVSSADAYAWWDEEPATGPDPGVLIAAVETGNVELLGPSAFNDLQRPVAARHPVIERTIAAFVEAGALGAVMTGSGPTVIAPVRHVGHAAALVDAVPGSMAVFGPPSAG